MNTSIALTVDGFPRFALPLAEVRAISKFLDDEYGIHAYSSFEAWTTARDNIRPASLNRDLYNVISELKTLVESRNHDAEYLALRDEASDRLFTILANKAVGSVVHSQKRAYIIDSIAAAVAAIRGFEVTGTILDVGCNTGYVTRMLAQLTGLSVVGTDRCRAAIDAAKRMSKAETVEYLVTVWRTMEVAQPFGAIVASDLNLEPEEMPAFLAKSDNLLAPDGIIVLIQDQPLAWAKEARRFQSMGWKLIHAEATGGWAIENGAERNFFGAKTVFVLDRGEHKPTRHPIAAPSWPTFARYCNTPQRSLAEMTQAYFLAQFGTGGR